MSEMTTYRSGTFCWVDLATSDAGAAKRFYAELFGWQTEDQRAGPDRVYTMARRGRRDVAGLYELTEAQRAEGAAPHWLSFVAVSSADASAVRAVSLGGKVLMDAFDVMDVGRMALLEDSTGAPIAVWQANRHAGAGLVNEHGTFCWNELATTDVARAREFYTGLFGWSAQELEMGPTSYTMLMNGERPAGGMLQMTPGWQVPPHWIVYFAVDDTDAAVQRAVAANGEARVPPTDIPNVGRFSLLQDPQGAAFAVIKLRQPPS